MQCAAEFTDVLQSGDGVFGIFVDILLFQSGLTDYIVHEFLQRHGVLHCAEHSHQRGKVGYGIPRSGTQRFRKVVQGAEQGNPGGGGIIGQCLDGGIPDGTFRNIDNPPEGNIIRRIYNDAKICQDIADFLSLVELLSAL